VRTRTGGLSTIDMKFGSSAACLERLGAVWEIYLHAGQVEGLGMRVVLVAKRSKEFPIRLPCRRILCGCWLAIDATVAET
jgi:hypothetical protein